jgi:hypothetical protein
MGNPLSLAPAQDAAALIGNSASWPEIGGDPHFPNPCALRRQLFLGLRCIYYFGSAPGKALPAFVILEQSAFGHERDLALTLW